MQNKLHAKGIWESGKLKGWKLYTRLGVFNQLCFVGYRWL